MYLDSNEQKNLDLSKLKEIAKGMNKLNVEFINKLNAIDSQDRTALHRACKNNQVEDVKFITSYKIKVNLKDKQGLTPLHIAIQNGNLEITRLLLLAGADKNVKNKDNQTALQIAEKNKNTKLIELLKSSQIKSVVPKNSDSDDFIIEESVEEETSEE